MECDWDKIDEQIVSETFDTLSIDEAIALVGILYDFKIKFSDELRTLAQKVEGWEPQGIRPFDIQAAATWVADQFQLDQDKLIRGFHSRWSAMKVSETSQRVKEAIESHRFVSCLEPYSDVP